MFKRIDHVEIVPTDMDAAIRFFQDVFGFKLIHRSEVDQPPLKETAKLQLGDAVVELLYAENAAQKSDAPWQVGYRGIAIEVDDMKKAVEYLNRKGIEITKGPVDLGSSERAEMKGPDGIQIELRQWK
jgi:glyoxylase I family protein